MYSDFQKWCLCLPVPSWNLAALTAPGLDELKARAELLAFDLCEQTDREMCQLMIEIGQQNLEELFYEHKD